MLLIYNTIEKKERTINFGPQEQEILDQLTNFELHLQFKLGMPHSLLTCSSWINLLFICTIIYFTA